MLATIRTTYRWPTALATLLLATCLLWPGLAHGQNGEDLSPTEEQQELNDEAVRAIIERDYAKAVALLEEALLIGELNVTYYNLATAYEGLDECRKAKKALDAAESAPEVQRPSPERLRAKIEELRTELPDQCPETQIESTSTLPPSSEQPERTYAESSAVLPIYLYTTAAVFVGTGTALHLVARGKRQQVRDDLGDDDIASELTFDRASELESQANTFDTIALGAVIAGGIAAATGTYFLLRNEAPETQTATTGPAPSVFVGQGGLGITLRGSF
jgi:tetratricopeptide (TPR) repeat protein